MIEYQLFSYPRPKLMVVSHERSGTHFLMNSIAQCFGYVALPWVNLDRVPYPINYFSSRELEEFFGFFRGHHLSQIVKSHHSFDFFERILPTVCEEFHIFYVYRDPRDVMVSMCRFLKTIPWHEGPKADDVRAFIRDEPSGQMMRYQWRQQPTMIHRWRSHVDRWTTDFPEQYRSKITFIRFRDLLHDYENVIRQIGQLLGSPTNYLMPSLEIPSVAPHIGAAGRYREFFDADDLALFREIAGPTMDRLGFTA